MNIELTKQHLSTRIFRSYLWYLKKFHPNISLDNICKEAGLPLSYLQDENNWVSVTFDDRFTNICINATGDADLCNKVGLIAVSEEVLGTILFSLAKYSMNPEIIYDNLPKIIPKFNRIMQFKTLKRLNGRRKILITPIYDGLSANERAALNSNFINIVRNSEGYWAAIPTIFNEQIARSTSTKVLTENGVDAYELEFEYTNLEGSKLGVAVAISAAAFSTIFLLFYLKSLVSQQVLSLSATIALSLLLFFIFHRYAKVKKALAQSDQTLQKLDDQYLVLQNTKESLQRRYQEAKLLHKLSENLTKARSKHDVIFQSTEDIISTLGYDRVLVLLADYEHNKLAYAHSKGPDEKLVAAFKQFSLPLKITSTDPKKVTNVYQTGEPFLIDDVRKHLPTLNEESRRALLLTGSRSFLCVAINSETTKHGILCVDYQTRSKKLTVDDLDVMRSVGRQIALALDKEDATENSIVALKKADKIKDEFLANTSHELRTPLHGIIGLTESLIDGASGKLSKDTVSNLNMIVSSGKRLASLVNDILDFSKLKNEPIHLNLKPLSVNGMVELVFTLLAPSLKGKNLKLINKVSAEADVVFADENRLQQIMLNLLGNAIKFTKQGEVSVETRKSGDLVEFKISDTGKGIAKESLNIIFEAFKQEDGTTSREYGGTGLGLSITKSLIENHGGRIWAESEVGCGSKFYFTLKSTVEKPSELVNHTEKKFAVANTTEKNIQLDEAIIPVVANGFKVLIVDDESINRQVLFNYLIPQGYSCIEASSGQEALDKIGLGFKPDVVLLDVMMPGMTGFEACQKMRALLSRTDVPILFLTAKNQITDIVQGLSVGANDYLTKPFSKEELLARIANHLGLAKTVSSYCRFVPFEFIDLLNKETVLQIGLGDNIEREMSVMFIDIRDFSRYSENHSPLETFKALNRFFSYVAPLVRKHHGFIDKYTGDGLMAIFPTSLTDAICAATEIVKVLTVFNHEELNNNRIGIKTGIGINSGKLILGTIGYEHQMQGTVISDSVNVASRLESLTKEYGASIIVPEELMRSLPDNEKVSWRKLGETFIKGKTTPIRIAEIYSGDPDLQVVLKNKTKNEFEQAVTSYSNGDMDTARHQFETVLSKNPMDAAAKFFQAQIINSQSVTRLPKAA